MPALRRSTCLAALAVLVATVVPAPTAGASTQCTAWGALPRRVSLASDHVTVTTVLRGTSGCHDQRTDNGASAYLRTPGGRSDYLRWRHFGSSQSIELYVSLNKVGTYRLVDGSVQLYNTRYRRVSWSWRRTAMIVKHAGRIVDAHAGAGVVTGRAQKYTKYGWRGFRDKIVTVQSRPVGTSAWHTLGSTRAGARGVVSFTTATSSRYAYRLEFATGSTVWGARSAAVRG